MNGKDILIVVDYQNDFVDGALGFESAPAIDAGIATLAQEYAENENGMLIATLDTHFDNYLETQEGKNLPVPHCIRLTDGWQLYGKTGEYIRGLYEGVAAIDDNFTLGDCVLETDTSDTLNVYDRLYLIEKPTFPSLALGAFLKDINKQFGVNSITLVGLVTNMCVIGNAVIAKAACPEAEIIIKKDLVDSFDKELHAKTLEIAAAMQMTIV